MASSFDAFKNLDLSRDEVDRIGTALKDQQFRKLLADYVDEIKNPENKRLYEQEITQLEKERGVDVTFINPLPGYVIKTSADGSTKAFINVCVNEHVGKPSSTPSHGVDGARGLQWSLPHTLSPPREDYDNKRNKCVVYDVVFHPDSLRLANSNKEFRAMVNSTACDAVEEHFSVALDKRNLKFPNVQYKGCAHASIIRKASGEKLEEKSPEEQAFLDQIYANIPQSTTTTTTPQQKPVNVTKTVDNNNTKYTTPKYVIKHRSHIEMEQFTENRDAKMHSAIPKELIIEVNLPLLKSSADLALDVTEKTVQLTSERPAKYKLNLTLPYAVNQDLGNARFEKDVKKLIVTLPVIRQQNNFVVTDVNSIEDSGVDSDHNSPNSADESVPEVATFFDDIIDYTLPEYSCNVFENILAFTFKVKNVNEASIKQEVTNCDMLLLQFTSISSGYFPVHYGIVVKLPQQTLTPENITVEAWDNNVTVQVTLSSDITSFLIGVKEDALQEAYPEEPSIIHAKLQNSFENNNTELCEDDNVDSVENNNEENNSEDTTDELERKTRALDIRRANSESSSDEQSCSYSPSRSKGILKRLAARSLVGRSISESSVDEVQWASSFENCYNSMDSVIPEEETGGSLTKKTVRFSEHIGKQLFRSNSSILGQKKKNQRKARNKKRAQERRYSESEISESDDRIKEGDVQSDDLSISSSKNEHKDLQIFDLDM